MHAFLVNPSFHSTYCSPDPVPYVLIFSAISLAGVVITINTIMQYHGTIHASKSL